ncbi:MAG: hypothetical protein WCI78_15030, partial [Mycobacterium sp.]
MCGEDATMTHSYDNTAGADLLDLAVPYAFHALPDDERDELEDRIATAGLAVADAFYDEVRAVRETMAVASAASAEEPPAELRGRLLSAVADDNVRFLRTPNRRRTVWMSAAAALVVGLITVGIGVSLRPPAQTPSTAEQVFEASDERLERTIALKILLGEHLGSAKVRQRFEREAKVIARVRHPNVIEIFDYFPYGNDLVLALEYLGTLADRIGHGLAVTEVVRMGRGLLAGL